MAEKKKEVGVLGVLGFLLVLALKGVAISLAIATPVLGVWVSSSLAAYLNGPIWATILVGLLFFPLLPLAWEGFSAWRRSRKEEKPERVLTFLDRMVLRTLFLNFTFLVILLLAKPEAGFTALQARGDWMLEGSEAPWVSKTRPYLFRAANGLEWLYVAARENPYAEENPDEGALPDVLPQEGGDTSGGGDDSGESGQGGGDETPDKSGGSDGLGGQWGGTDDGGQQAGGEKGGETGETGGTGKTGGPTGRDKSPVKSKRPTKVQVLWPSPAKLHPVVAAMPAAEERSIEAVGAYLKARINDDLGLVRAAHDWVADRIAYDVPVYDAFRLRGVRIPPQGPEIIFKNRVGVCSGYARLLRELGKNMGVEIVYVVGDSRNEHGDLTGMGHAWNAAKIDGVWHLIDATWNAGSVGDGHFKKEFNTRYFLTPPEVFGLDHFPDEPRWQLRKTPVSRGDFIRQPALDPRFFVHKMKLIDPTRSQITVEREAVIRIQNPTGMFMLADYRPVKVTTGDGTRCQVNQGPEVRINCKFSRQGNWRVNLFLNRERYGRFSYAGQIMVNSR